MKKFILFVVSFMLAMTCISCSGSTKVDEKSEQDIISDLSQNDSFWLKVAPALGSDAYLEYEITDFNINIRETDPENSDHLFVTISAASEFATYTGNFNLVYEYHDQEGYVLKTVYQDYGGTYEITGHPTEDMAKAFFAKNLAPQYNNTELLDILIDENSGREDLLGLQYTHRYAVDQYCSAIEVLTYPYAFINGTWVVDTNYYSEPFITYEYDLPEVSDIEITNAVSLIIPKHIGVYDGVSGTVEKDENDEMLVHVTGCHITSTTPEIIDTSNVSLDLTLHCEQLDNYRWHYVDSSMQGQPIFSNAGKFILNNPAGHVISVELLPTVDIGSSSVIYSVITTDIDPLRAGIPNGEKVERIMEFGTMANVTNGRSYYLRDETYYIYMDESMQLLDFLYAD